MELEWHLQVTSLTGRLLPPGGFEAQVPYAATLQVEVLGGGFAYIHSALRKEGRALTRRDFADVARKLMNDWGVTHVLMLRDGEMEIEETARFARGSI
ncbi:hypothetical protein ACFJGW_00515 [Burkholderiaceae bacterium UC74_6]